MNSDERARLPIPECCTRCAHCETWRSAGNERHACLRGHPMHNGCTWLREKQISLIAETSK